MGNLGVGEILVIAVVALLVFGPQRLPEIARNVGRGIREIKKVTGGLTETFTVEWQAASQHPQPIPASDTSRAPDRPAPGADAVAHDRAAPAEPAP